MGRPTVFTGPIIHSAGQNELELVEKGILIVDSEGQIAALHKDDVAAAFSPSQELLNTAEFITLHDGEFLMPGFVDTHNHAPQWAMRGLGQGLHILDWLDKVTFPHEARCEDPTWARNLYEDCVDGFLRQGITTACYYGSKHDSATCILADVCLQKGQRALVGKCNMDRNAPDYLRDQSAATSLRETKHVVEYIRSQDPEGKRVQPVLTPRFAICCTPELLQGLGEMAEVDPTLAVQTHFNEAQQEIEATRELFPQFKSEADLYEHYGLLGKRSILAHCTHMTDHEMERIKHLECGVAHCPIANMTVGGGFMVAAIRQFLQQGIKVGLGTDSGGGFSSGMLDTIRQAMIASNAKEVLSEGKDTGLSINEVFYLATLGGAKVCNIDDKVGNFEVGKWFDAIVVKPDADGVMTKRLPGDSVETIFEKFIMTGDDRNIGRVYVDGLLVRTSKE